MSGLRSTNDPKVTAEDLRGKWDEIKGAVKRQAEQRVMGLSYLALGGIAVGVGALGLAFWVGRRSAARTRSAPASGESAGETQGPQSAARGRGEVSLSRALRPALERAVNGAVQSAMEALSKRLKREGTQGD